MAEPADDDSSAETHPAPHAAAAHEEISILVLSGPGVGHFHKVPREGGLIGRDTSVEVSIPDPALAQHHAQLERQKGGGFVLRDLGGRHGVLIDGRRTASRMLADGDRIQLSDETVIRVRYHEGREAELLVSAHEPSLRDPLTGVANRRYLLERLEQELGFSRRHGAPFTLLMLDIDFFKRINDEHGQTVGDQALRTVARALHAAVRVEDVLARYGGDEFTVLSRGYDHREGMQFGERLVKAIRDKTIRTGERSLQVTLSAGVASYHRGEPESHMHLIARAETALFRAKHGGRNQVAVWNGS